MIEIDCDPVAPHYKPAMFQGKFWIMSFSIAVHLFLFFPGKPLNYPSQRATSVSDYALA